MPKAKPKPAAKPWPDRVRALMDRYGWTQAELATRLGVSQPAVCRYLAGTRPVPRTLRILIEWIEAGKIPLA